MRSRGLGGLGLCVAVLGGCQELPLRPGRYAIHARDAEFPVMLSRTPVREPGRRIRGSSNYESADAGAAFVMGGTMIYVNRQQSFRSEMSARTELLTKVQRKERWVQLTGAGFFASDKAEFGQTVVLRSLAIEGAVYR